MHTSIYTVHCGYPQAPRGGHLVDNFTTEEGSEVLYKCDEGLTPQGIMRALCTEGFWRPRPVDLICKSIHSDQPSTTAGKLKNKSIVKINATSITTLDSVFSASINTLLPPAVLSESHLISCSH